MATVTGTALNYNDLLDKLRTALIGFGWTSLEYTPKTDLTPGAKLVMRGEGLTTGAEPFIYINTVSDVTLPAYSWNLALADAYQPGVPDGSQSGMLGSNVYTNLWSNSIQYWIYGDSKHFKMVARMGTVYTSIFMGVFLPFAAPTEHLRPFAVLGNYSIAAEYNRVNAGHTFFVRPGDGAYYKNRNGVWAAISAQRASPNIDINMEWTPTGIIWPYATEHQFASGGNPSSSDWTLAASLKLYPNKNGEAFSCQTLIISLDQTNRENSYVVGTLPGVLYTAGFGRVSEQTLTYNGQTYRLFQNLYRSSPRDFVAILED